MPPLPSHLGKFDCDHHKQGPPLDYFKVTWKELKVTLGLQAWTQLSSLTAGLDP